MPFPSILFRATLLAMTLLLGGCDLLDTLMADPKAIQKEADAKAIGAGCRHGLRSIEDCYSMNERAPKAAIFTGWKDMDQYMRDNKIEGVESKGLKVESASAIAAGEEVVSGPAKADKKPAEPGGKAAADSAKGAGKNAGKADSKG